MSLKHESKYGLHIPACTIETRIDGRCLRCPGTTCAACGGTTRRPLPTAWRPLAAALAPLPPTASRTCSSKRVRLQSSHKPGQARHTLLQTCCIDRPLYLSPERSRCPLKLVCFCIHTGLLREAASAQPGRASGGVDVRLCFVPDAAAAPPPPSPDRWREIAASLLLTPSAVGTLPRAASCAHLTPDANVSGLPLVQLPAAPASALCPAQSLPNQFVGAFRFQAAAFRRSKGEYKQLQTCFRRQSAVCGAAGGAPGQASVQLPADAGRHAAAADGRPCGSRGAFHKGPCPKSNCTSQSKTDGRGPGGWARLAGNCATGRARADSRPACQLLFQMWQCGLHGPLSPFEKALGAMKSENARSLNPSAMLQLPASRSGGRPGDQGV